MFCRPYNWEVVFAWFIADLPLHGVSVLYVDLLSLIQGRQWKAFNRSDDGLLIWEAIADLLLCMHVLLIPPIQTYDSCYTHLRTGSLRRTVDWSGVSWYWRPVPCWPKPTCIAKKSLVIQCLYRCFHMIIITPWEDCVLQITPPADKQTTVPHMEFHVYILCDSPPRAQFPYYRQGPYLFLSFVKAQSRTSNCLSWHLLVLLLKPSLSYAHHGRIPAHPHPSQPLALPARLQTCAPGNMGYIKCEYKWQKDQPLQTKMPTMVHTCKHQLPAQSGDDTNTQRVKLFGVRKQNPLPFSMSRTTTVMTGIELHTVGITMDKKTGSFMLLTPTWQIRTTEWNRQHANVNTHELLQHLSTCKSYTGLECMPQSEHIHIGK